MNSSNEASKDTHIVS